LLDVGAAALTPRAPAPWKPGERVAVYARSDYQAISSVPGCSEQHTRPIDSRTGLPVPIWELNCPAHEAWICGAGQPKIIEWQPNGHGGFSPIKVAPMQAGWSRTVEGIPLTPDQLRAEVSRNGLTRRTEQPVDR